GRVAGNGERVEQIGRSEVFVTVVVDRVAADIHFAWALHLTGRIQARPGQAGGRDDLECRSGRVRPLQSTVPAARPLYDGQLIAGRGLDHDHVDGLAGAGGRHGVRGGELNGHLNAGPHRFPGLGRELVHDPADPVARPGDLDR